MPSVLFNIFHPHRFSPVSGSVVFYFVGAHKLWQFWGQWVCTLCTVQCNVQCKLRILMFAFCAFCAVHRLLCIALHPLALHCISCNAQCASPCIVSCASPCIGNPGNNGGKLHQSSPDTHTAMHRVMHRVIHTVIHTQKCTQEMQTKSAHTGYCTKYHCSVTFCTFQGSLGLCSILLLVCTFVILHNWVCFLSICQQRIAVVAGEYNGGIMASVSLRQTFTNSIIFA